MVDYSRPDPPGEGQSGHRDRLGQAITSQLLDFMERGVPVTDDDGNVVRNDDGEEIRTPPSAALVGQAIKWFDRMKRDGEGGGKSPVQEAFERMRQAQAAGGELPPVDVDGEDPAS